jgi:peptidoglycan/xylan/chitin deacetylase (PgdA/CDA1 family)
VNPAVVVSLDFELRWGLLGVLGDDMNEYRENLEGVEEVVPRLLEMFRERGVRATWATVGALACRDWDEWHARTPAIPRYENPVFAWRDVYERRDPRGRLHFAPHLVNAIVAAHGQELGSHTFGHVFFREPGFTRGDAVADTDAVIRVFEERWKVTVKTCVFPRNQVAHTDVLQERGIAGWRNTPKPFYWSAGTQADQTLSLRMLRALDSLVPLGRRAASSRALRSSYFVRLTLPPMLWRQHCRRVVNDARGLQDDETLHLWFHPHNIGGNPKKGVGRFAELIDRVHHAAPRSVRFLTMGDVVRTASGTSEPELRESRYSQ